MTKMKVGSVSYQYTWTGKSTSESNKTFNTFALLTDDEFAEEVEEEEVEAVQEQNTEPKRFQTKPLPPPKPARKHIYMYIYCKVPIPCWFTLQTIRSTSLSLITGPVPGTSNVDNEDLPKEDLALTKTELQKKAADTGNL